MGFLVTLKKANHLPSLLTGLKEVSPDIEFQVNYLRLIDSFNPNKTSDFFIQLSKLYFQYAESFENNATMKLSSILGLICKTDYSLGLGTKEESSEILNELFPNNEIVPVIKETKVIPVDISEKKDELAEVIPPEMQVHAVNIEQIKEEVQKLNAPSVKAEVKETPMQVQPQTEPSISQTVSTGTCIAKSGFRKHMDNIAAFVIAVDSVAKRTAFASKLASFISGIGEEYDKVREVYVKSTED